MYYYIKMKWSDEVFFNKAFSIELIRYFILIIAIVVIGNMSASIQPWATKTLGSFWIQCFILFLALLLSIYNIEQKITYKSLLYSFIISVVIGIILFFCVIKNTESQHINQTILLDKIRYLENQLQKKGINNNDLETSTPIK